MTEPKSSYIGALIKRRWRITELIGKGGFGYVYKGTDTKTEEVAIKMEKRAGKNYLESEAQFYRELRGEHGVPAALWFGQHDGSDVLVTALKGPSLFGFVLSLRQKIHPQDRINAC